VEDAVSIIRIQER